MAGNVAPNTVTDGLVLYLDAANTKSYVSGSTTWNDISGNNINGTLTNGPTFNTGSGGSIVFDGVDDYIQGPISSILNFCSPTNDLPFSTSVWCYINSLTTLFMLYNKGDNGGGSFESYAAYVTTAGKVVLALYDSSGPNQSTATSVASVPTGQWLNIVTTYSGTGGNTNIKIYVNATLQTVTTGGQGAYTRMRQQNTNIWLGSFGSVGAFRSIVSNGRYSSFLFYNRELNSSEITQNYNTTRTRYGL